MKEFANEKPYAVAFTTDSDCITLSLVLNTYEYLEKTGLAKDDKWYPDEWGYSVGSYQFDNIAQELYQKYSSLFDQITNQNPDLTFEEVGDLYAEYHFKELFLKLSPLLSGNLLLPVFLV